jgi:hypothetical protein
MTAVRHSMDTLTLSEVLPIAATRISSIHVRMSRQRKV